MGLTKTIKRFYYNLVINPEKGVGKVVIIVIVALIIIAAVAGFMMMQPKTETKTQITPTSVPTVTQEAQVPNKVKIEVEGSSFKFSPTNITVKKGEAVTIVFKNAGGIHDFVIDEFNVKTAQIQGGAMEEVTFTPDKAGTFEFYCSVGNHRAMGMVGTLTVTE